jgi:opacity protein-like surface antigen
MKKKIFLTLAFAALFASASFGQLKFGGGLTLGSKVGIDDDGDEKMGFGLNIRADYAINDKFSIAPGFTYFFPSTPSGYDLTMWQLNADAHYNFAETGNTKIYGIGGLNYSYIKAEFDWGFGEVSADDSEIGVDLGVGANMGILFGEVKYDTAYEQIGLTVGVLFGGN